MIEDDFGLEWVKYMFCGVVLSLSDVMERLQDVIGELKKRREVIAILLFGSRATGRAKPGSDFDICVVARRDISKKLREEILSYSSGEIDTTLFWDLPPAIRFRVLKEGKLLYERDRLELHRIKIYAMKSYRDIQPMLKRHVSKIIGE